MLTSNKLAMKYDHVITREPKNPAKNELYFSTLIFMIHARIPREENLTIYDTPYEYNSRLDTLFYPNSSILREV